MCFAVALVVPIAIPFFWTSSTAAVTGVATTYAGSLGGAAAGTLGATGLAVGTDDGGASWDCWKPVVMCEDPAPSERGMPLGDLLAHPNVRVTSGPYEPLKIQNIAGERFRIDALKLADGTFVTHATPLA